MRRQHGNVAGWVIRTRGDDVPRFHLHIDDLIPIRKGPSYPTSKPRARKPSDPRVQ